MKESKPIKVRISATSTEEIYLVIAMLQPRIKSFKIAHNDTGPYKKAYVELT